MLKKCKDCKKKLPEDKIYFFNGYLRTNCKECHRKRIKARQKITKPWRNRDKEKQAALSKVYYQENKEKFEEYRKTFAERHPNYYREYAKKHYQQKKAKKGLAK